MRELSKNPTKNYLKEYSLSNNQEIECIHTIHFFSEKKQKIEIPEKSYQVQKQKNSPKNRKLPDWAFKNTQLKFQSEDTQNQTIKPKKKSRDSFPNKTVEKISPKKSKDSPNKDQNNETEKKRKISMENEEEIPDISNCFNQIVDDNVLDFLQDEGFF